MKCMYLYRTQISIQIDSSRQNISWGHRVVEFCHNVNVVSVFAEIPDLAMYSNCRLMSLMVQEYVNNLFCSGRELIYSVVSDVSIFTENSDRPLLRNCVQLSCLTLIICLSPLENYVIFIILLVVF
jgi:hypothetical protein